MNETFLNDHQTDTLTRQLRDLGDALPALEAATARTASRAPGSHACTASQAAVRNQFVDCDPNTDQPADWIVQTGHVRWENP
ncbi:hypothetical protein ACWIDS_16260 [Dietzia maris]